MNNDYNGCSDPDYYDIEFREQNPDVYGDDDLMQSYRESRVERPRSRGYSRNYNYRGRRNLSADDEFHQEYMQWRRNNPSRLEEWRKPSIYPNGHREEEGASAVLLMIIIIAIIVFIMVFMFG